MKHHITIISLLILLTSVASSSCSRISYGQKLPSTLGDKPHPIEPIELTSEQQQFVIDGNNYAFRMAAVVEESEKGDVLLSPLSASYVLGMISNGACGLTREQMAATLGFSSANESAMNDFFHLMLTGAPKVDPSIKIEIANAILANNNYPLKKAFKQSATEQYMAEVKNMDFASVDVAGLVNKWASDHTHGMIRYILDETSPDASLYAMNAIYFKGSWCDEFDKKDTRNEDFTTNRGEKKTVEMMHRNDQMRYVENDMFSMVRLPYGNEGYSMEVLLPAEGKTIADVLASLNGESWQQAMQSASKYMVDLKLPKFSSEYSIILNSPLKQLGMKDAFSPSAADFTRLSDRSAYISRVLQKCKIEVDEKGTEAAAVTVVEMRTTSSAPRPTPTAIFHANRPFIYIITENTTGSIYFIGMKTE